MRSTVCRPQAHVASREVPSDRLNTLGLGARELGILTDFLDSRGASDVSRKRQFARWPFRCTGVDVHLSHPGGSTTVLKLAGRNLSRGGISLLHRGFVHPGTQCRVDLPRPDGHVDAKDGVVARCVHVKGTLHELGIKFEKNIRLREYANPSPGADALTIEHADPKSLSGRVLVVSPAETDARILSHFLRDTSLQCVAVPSGADAIAKAPDGFDLVLMDTPLPDVPTIDLLRQLRTLLPKAPLLAASASPKELMGHGLWDLSPVGVIDKPYTQGALLRQIAELLLFRDSSSGAPPSP